MNFKKHTSLLENILVEELKNKPPIALLDNNSVLYLDFRIKKNKVGKWALYRINGFLIDTFNLKTCALLAAKLLNANNLKGLNEIKQLDDSYFKHHMDTIIHKNMYTNTKDSVKKDVNLWRWQISKEKTDSTKRQIISRFKFLF
jgi:hypothetical protein